MYLNLGHRGTLQILKFQGQVEKEKTPNEGKTLKVAPRRCDTLFGVVGILNWN